LLINTDIDKPLTLYKEKKWSNQLNVTEVFSIHL
jgi:hypothetical protein